MSLGEAWNATSKISYVTLGVAVLLIVLKLMVEAIPYLIVLYIPFEHMRLVGLIVTIGVNWLGVMLAISILTTIYGHVIEDRPLVD